MPFPKTITQIDSMRKGGKILSAVLQKLQAESLIGKTGEELNTLAERIIHDAGAEPAFFGYRGFPATICLSLNDEVLHGIPLGKRLKSGDLVTLDAGVLYEEMYTDAAVSFFVGEEKDSQEEKFLDAGKEALRQAIAIAVEGGRVGDISNCIQKIIEENGFSVVRDYCGHGVGFSLHEGPSIPCYGEPGQGERLKNGQTLAIEVMYVKGQADLVILSDGWTAVTKDKSLGAVFEQTILVTDQSPEILTL